MSAIFYTALQYHVASDLCFTEQNLLTITQNWHSSFHHKYPAIFRLIHNVLFKTQASIW